MGLVERGGDRLGWPLRVHWTVELEMRSEWRAHLYEGRPYGGRHIRWKTVACGGSRCVLWCASVMAESTGRGMGCRPAHVYYLLSYAVLHFMENLVNPRANRSRERNRAPGVKAN